jgi:xanthine dehydrogenase/oxidase
MQEDELFTDELLDRRVAVRAERGLRTQGDETYDIDELLQGYDGYNPNQWKQDSRRLMGLAACIIGSATACLMASKRNNYGDYEEVIQEEMDPDQVNQEEMDAQGNHEHGTTSKNAQNTVPEATDLQSSVAASKWSTSITFWVDGVKKVLHNPSPSVLLLAWLREEDNNYGTHVGCGEGGCGICTVALVTPDGKTVPINACLRRVVALDGCHVITTRGLGSKDKPHALQQSIADGNGSQCGFCTPGWVMQMYSLLEQNNKPSAEEVEKNFDGNLCRCTGYRPILNAYAQFAKGGKRCGDFVKVKAPAQWRSYTRQPLLLKDEVTKVQYYRPLTHTQLMEAGKHAGDSLPVRYVCANTGEGIEKYIAPAKRSKEELQQGSVLIDVSCVEGMTTVEQNAGGLTFGAAVSIEVMLDTLRATSSDAFAAYAEHLAKVGCKQIRSVGSWAGNLMLVRSSNLVEGYKYFTSDILLVLETACARVRAIVDNEEADLSPLQLVDLPLNKHVLLLSVHIPRPPSHAFVRTYKCMQRHANSGAIVNLGVYFAFKEDGHVSDARIVVGGAAPKVMVVPCAAHALVGRPLDEHSLERLQSLLERDIRATRTHPASGVVHCPVRPKGSGTTYKDEVANAFLYKAFLEHTHEEEELEPSLVSAVVPFRTTDARPISSGDNMNVDLMQATEAEGKGRIGSWQPKTKSLIQATGELKFPSDHGHGQLFGQLVLATSCKAKLKKLDKDAAMDIPGVQHWIDAADIPGENNSYAFFQAVQFVPNGEKIFHEVGDVIPYVGASLGMIVATTWATARLAAKAVGQIYEDHQPVILSKPKVENATSDNKGGYDIIDFAQEDIHRLHRAREENNLFRARPVTTETELNQGPGYTVKAGQKEVTGVFQVGGQQFFYMETNACSVEPSGGKIEVCCSDQMPSGLVNTLAAVLKKPPSHFDVKNVPIGGGFGGKIALHLISACATAVAANKIKKGVRMQLERSDDMMLSGGRVPHEYDYRAAYDEGGKLCGLQFTVCGEAGYNQGLTPAMLEGHTIHEADNAFNWGNSQNHKYGMKIALSDKPQNGAFRGPGQMQVSLFTAEVIDQIARKLGKDVQEVMEQNFYKKGDTTWQGNVIEEDGFNFTVPHLWKKVQEAKNDGKTYAQRKLAVAEYNSANKWSKKGIAITAIKYPILPAANGPFYNHACMVKASADGKVVVQTTGVEMGQGLDTKVALAVAETLNLNLDDVSVEGAGNTAGLMGTAGSLNGLLPAGGMTGGQATSEICAKAAEAGAKALLNKLDVHAGKKQNWAEQWKSACEEANKHGPVIEVGRFINPTDLPEVGGPVSKCLYGLYGVATTEVLLDVLTGEIRVERSDLVMDAGHSLDPAVDVGQIEGTFIQTLGYVLTEEEAWDAKTGTPRKAGTLHYKVPTAYDIPVEFNVQLSSDAPNQRAIFKSSKASGESAIMLASSPFLAVKDAIYAARKELGKGDAYFPLSVPATPEVVRTAIGRVTADEMKLH